MLNTFTPVKDLTFSLFTIVAVQSVSECVKKGQTDSTVWPQMTSMNYKASLIDRRGQRSANSVCLHSPGTTARRDFARPLEKWQQQWNWTPAHKCPLWDWGHGRCVNIWFTIFLCCPTELTYTVVDASSMLAELVWQHGPSHSRNECLKVTLKCTPSFILI